MDDEKTYIEKLKFVRKRLPKAHIPAVATETGFSDKTLRLIFDEDKKVRTKRPGKQMISDLFEYLSK